MIVIEDMGVPEDVKIDESTSIQLNVQNMVLNTAIGFFRLEPGDNGMYGLTQPEIDDLVSTPDDKKVDKFLNQKNIPSPKQPGLSNIIDKFIRAITKSMLFFAKQFIAMKEAAISLIEALKNPTDPENIKIISKIIEKLKGILESIKKFFTDTVKWMMETFMGPLGEIKVSVPSFIFNLGEIIPAFPFPVPIPEMKPSKSDMSSFEKKDSTDDINKVMEQIYGYKDYSNMALLSVYKNTPYIENIDTNTLVDKTFKERKPADKEKGAADLKNIAMFKGVSTSPIKIIIGLINALVGAVIGLLSFDFSKIIDLVKMMSPTMDGMKQLVSTLLDGMIPNASKVLEKNQDIKPPSTQQELKSQTDKIKSTNVGNLEFDGPSEKDMETKIESADKSINNLYKGKNKITNKESDSPLKDYIKHIRNNAADISKSESAINGYMSKINSPNTYQVMDKTILKNDIISNVNSLDTKVDSDGNKVESTEVEDNITNFFDNINKKIKDIKKYEGNKEINDFFNYYKNVKTFPLNIEDVYDYINTTNEFLSLNKDTITDYFKKYNKDYVDDMIKQTQDAINYVKKLRYIKYITKTKLRNYLSNYKKLLADFRDNILMKVGDEWITPINNYSFDNLERIYNEIVKYTYSDVYTMFSKSTEFAQNVSLIRAILSGIKTSLRDFTETKKEIESTDEHFKKWIRTPTFSKEEIDDVITNIDKFLNIHNYNTMLLIEYDITSVEQYTYGDNNYEEDVVIQYLNKIKDMYYVEKELIDFDISYGKEHNTDENSIRNKFTDFLVTVIDKSDELENNDDNLMDSMKDAESSIALQKKLATTPPDTELISQYALPLSGIIENMPKVFLEIFKGIFNYALEGLPFSV